MPPPSLGQSHCKPPTPGWGQKLGASSLLSPRMTTQRASSAGQAEGDGLTGEGQTVTQSEPGSCKWNTGLGRLWQALSLSQSQKILARNLTTEQGKALGNTWNQARPLVMLDSWQTTRWAKCFFPTWPRHKNWAGQRGPKGGGRGAREGPSRKRKAGSKVIFTLLGEQSSAEGRVPAWLDKRPRSLRLSGASHKGLCDLLGG